MDLGEQALEHDYEIRYRSRMEEFSSRYQIGQIHAEPTGFVSTGRFDGHDHPVVFGAGAATWEPEPSMLRIFLIVVVNLFSFFIAVASALFLVYWIYRTWPPIVLRIWRTLRALWREHREPAEDLVYDLYLRLRHNWFWDRLNRLQQQAYNLFWDNIWRLLVLLALTAILYRSFKGFFYRQDVGSLVDAVPELPYWAQVALERREQGLNQLRDGPFAEWTPYPEADDSVAGFDDDTFGTVVVDDVVEPTTVAMFPDTVPEEPERTEAQTFATIFATSSTPSTIAGPSLPPKPTEAKRPAQGGCFQWCDQCRQSHC